jgi:hypothetical protein
MPVVAMSQRQALAGWPRSSVDMRERTHNRPVRVRPRLSDGKRLASFEWIPFVKGSKNDAVDAEAIFEAAMRPTMRFVPVKSTDQQDLQSLHRARDRLI